jgi:tetratricopeptide (TPR) repeat protein
VSEPMCDKNKITTLREKIKRSPSNNSVQTEMFWALYRCGAKSFEEGKIQEAINIALEMSRYLLAQTNAYNSIGWLIFKMLKAINSDEGLRKEFSYVVGDFVKALGNVELEGVLYSALYRMLYKFAEENSLWFLTFIKHHGLDKFSADDMKGIEIKSPNSNGKTRKTFPLYILVHMKAAKIIEKMFAESSVSSGNLSVNINSNSKRKSLEWFLPYLENAARKFPKEIWIVYHIGKFKLLLGDVEQARKYLLKVSEKQRKQFWIWANIGETYVENDKETALAYFSHAMQLLNNVEERHTLSLRFSAAQLLSELGKEDLAKTELEKVMSIREEWGYKTPDKLQRMLDKLSNVKSAEYDEVEKFYKEYSLKLEEILYSDLPEYIGIVENIKREKNWVFVRFSAENTARYVGKKANELNAGDVVKIKIKENYINGEKKYDAPIIKLSEDQELNLAFALKIKDVVEIDSKGHGHLQNYFIPQSMLKRNNIKDNDEISAIFIKERSGKSKCIVINKE